MSNYCQQTQSIPYVENWDASCRNIETETLFELFIKQHFTEFQLGFDDDTGSSTAFFADGNLNTTFVSRDYTFPLHKSICDDSIERSWFETITLIVELTHAESFVQISQSDKGWEVAIRQRFADQTTRACRITRKGFATSMDYIWPNGELTTGWIYGCNYFFPAIYRTSANFLDQTLEKPVNEINLLQNGGFDNIHVEFAGFFFRLREH